MELNQVEQLVLEEAAKKATAERVADLAEFHLAMVGGGIGDTIL